MKENLRKRQLAGQSHTHHDHPGNPKEKDVVASLKQRSRVERLSKIIEKNATPYVAKAICYLKILAFIIRPSHNREWEQARRKPGVKNIRILFKADFINRNVRVFCMCFCASFLLGAANNVVVLIGGLLLRRWRKMDIQLRRTTQSAATLSFWRNTAVLP